MLSSSLLKLSQSHLNLLNLCPPKFQQLYLDCLGSIPDPKQQDSMEWGSRFHLLMQQRELALPLESLLKSDRDLDASFQELVKAVPELSEPQKDFWREAEHCRTLGYGDFVLTVIYDLLIAGKDKAVIFDWKTYRQPQKRKNLANNWQTKLYLYVLVETSEYLPEQIQMTYWFVRSGKPKSLTFNYSQTLHQQTEKDLADSIAKLTQWLKNYQENKIDFPHRTDCEEKCPYFEFLAKKIDIPKDTQELLNEIAGIEEIPI